MEIKVATDRHSGISNTLAAQLGVAVLDMPYLLDGELYKNESSDVRAELMEKMRHGATVGSSQPSPGEVTDFWDEQLKDCDQLVYIPISSGLSGSCQMAQTLATLELYEGKVFVVDNGCVSTPQRRSVEYALELVKKGKNAAEIKALLEGVKEKMQIYLAVANLDYLKRGGRISGTKAVVGSLLNIKPIVTFSTGSISEYQNCRGMKKAKKTLIEIMKNELNTTVNEEYKKGLVSLLVASSANEEETMAWVQEVRDAFPEFQVEWDYLSLGVSCHTGPDILGIAYSCKPEC